MTIQEIYQEANNQGIFKCSNETVEFMQSLFDLYHSYGYAMSDEFLNALKEEISSIYDDIKDNITIKNKGIYVLQEEKLTQDQIDFIKSLPYFRKVEITYEF